MEIVILLILAALVCRIRENANQFSQGFARSPILFTFLALGLAVGTFSAQAKQMSCEDLSQWSHASYKADSHLRLPQYVKYQSNSRPPTQLLAGLKDENFIPLFGKSITDMSELDLNALIAMFKQCVSSQQFIHAAQKLRNACTLSRNRQSAECKRSQEVDGRITTITNYMGLMLGVNQQKQSFNHISKVFASQKEILKKKNEANAFIQNNHPKTKAPDIELSAINKLEMLKHQSILSFADPSSKSAFLIAIDNTKVEIADQLIGKYIQLLDIPISNLEELKVFAGFYNKVINEMGHYNATRWDEFKTRYDSVYAQHAQTMLPIFKTYLGKLPESPDSIGTARQTIQQLFPYTNAPKISQDYSAAVSLYSQDLTKLIAQRRCDDKVSQYKLTQYKDDEMLGAKGVMSFGEFICGLNEQRFKFDAIEAPGFFSSQYKAHFVTPRGVTLTLVLEPKEVTRGKEVLVGTSMINGGDERQLSTEQWQAQVALML